MADLYDAWNMCNGLIGEEARIDDDRIGLTVAALIFHVSSSFCEILTKPHAPLPHLRRMSGPKSIIASQNLVNCEKIVTFPCACQLLR
jgi:hypothetical protein